jgi:hypothetical protein
MELSTNQTWHTNFDAVNQSMELYFTDELADEDISNYLQFVHDLLSFMPVKTLIINDNKIKKDPLSLDWKIIESSWESLCKKGSEKIVIIHQTNLPVYVQKTYTNAIENYGLPIKLEFKPALSTKTN